MLIYNGVSHGAQHTSITSIYPFEQYKIQYIDMVDFYSLEENKNRHYSDSKTATARTP